MHRRQVVLVALASALFLALVAWGCAHRAAGPQTVTIDVTDRGFVPAEVKVHAGEPVTLLVTRKTDATCAKEFVIPQLGVRQALPLDQTVRIEVTPPEPGDVRFACGMDMVAGKFVVQ